MRNQHENNLLVELQTNPISFNEEKKGYNLLQEFLTGRLAVESLIPLLNSNNSQIHEPAIWIASELGNKCMSLIPTIISLLQTVPTRHVKYYALECITLCINEDTLGWGQHLVDAQEDEDELIRRHSSKLLSNLRSTYSL